MQDTTKAHLKRYAYSSLITFLSVFLPVLYIGFKDISWEAMEAAGFAGALAIIARLMVKAIWEGFLPVIGYLAELASEYYAKLKK